MAADKRKEYDEARQVLDDVEKDIAAKDKELRALQKERDAAAKQLNSVELEMKKLEGKIARFNKDQSGARKAIEEMEGTSEAGFRVGKGWAWSSHVPCAQPRICNGSPLIKNVKQSRIR